MEKVVRDVVMIGAGPSALAAAVYTTREDIDTVLYEKGVIGGLAAITDQIDNYPGFADGIAGLTLADQLQKQAERFGAHIEFGDVTSLRDNGDTKTVVVDDVEVIAKTVLIATGSDYNKLGVPGELEYYGRGVHYCATCDGAFYRDKRLVVVGGGNSAVQEAIFLTRFTTHIDLLVRSTIKASEVLQHELQKYVDEGKITVHLQTTTDEIVAVEG
jgi:thioredoxin reductase (NADPH)